MITLYDHPLSPYAQKVKISLREKGLAFETPMPGGLGAGGAQGAFVEASPRAEVQFCVKLGVTRPPIRAIRPVTTATAARSAPGPNNGT